VNNYEFIDKSLTKTLFIGYYITMYNHERYAYNKNAVIKSYLSEVRYIYNIILFGVRIYTAKGSEVQQSERLYQKIFEGLVDLRLNFYNSECIILLLLLYTCCAYNMIYYYYIHLYVFTIVITLKELVL